MKKITYYRVCQNEVRNAPYNTYSNLPFVYEPNVTRSGWRRFVIQTDVSIEEDVASLVEKTIEFYGNIDYTCNNAGVKQPLTPLAEQTSLDFDKIININVKGVWLCMKYQIPHILDNGNGVIVNMSSISRVSWFSKSPYLLCK